MSEVLVFVSIVVSVSVCVCACGCVRVVSAGSVGAIEKIGELGPPGDADLTRTHGCLAGSTGIA